MVVFHPEKVIGGLPSTLTLNAVYFVRVGSGIMIYVADATGSTAYAINQEGGGSVEDSWPITIFALTANDPRLEGTNFPKILTLPPFPTGVTINKISGLINSMSSGSAVLSIQNGTNTITGLDSLNCTTTVLADQLATANNILSAGGRLRISFTSITGLINISFRIDYTENP
jgi:hypothetical protein